MNFKDKKKLGIVHKTGDKMYVYGSMSLSHGIDDFAGGIATVKNIILSDHLPSDHCNYVMVVFEENPCSQYNYRSLLEKQKELKTTYGDQIAHPDPDDRPEFNDDHSGWVQQYGPDHPGNRNHLKELYVTDIRTGTKRLHTLED